MRGKSNWIILAICALTITIAAAGIALFSIRKADHALKSEKEKSRQKRFVTVHSREFKPSIQSGLRLLSGPSSVLDAVEFEGLIYTAASNGLLIFTPDGNFQKRIATDSGFPAGQVTSLAADRSTLWIGTQNNGLIRYASGKWVHFLPGKRQYRTIHSLLLTNQGTLFAGTGAGILKLNGNEFEEFYSNELSDTPITFLTGDQHRLLIGTFAKGLYIYEAGSLHHYGQKEGLLDPLVTDISESASSIYVSTPAGIQELRTNHFLPVTKNLFVTSFEESNGIIWAATQNRGVVQLRLASQTRKQSAYKNDSVFPSEKPGTILRKFSDSLLAFGREGSWYLQDRQWKPWGNYKGELSDNNVSSLLKTSSGELWVGYFDRGIDVLSEDQELLHHIEDETFFCINYLAADQSGNIYVSTANGLAIIHRDGTRKIYRMRDGLLSDRVMQALPLDPDGRKVAIATSQGFSLLENGQLKSVYAFHGLVSNHVYTIASNGNKIFLGTLGGISSLNGLNVVESWTQMDSGLKRNWVNALLSIDNRLIVGTYGSGLQQRELTGEWTAFEGLPDDFEVNPNALHSDGSLIFCGTLDRGFYASDLKQGRWKQITSGLPSLNVTAFAPDKGSVYVGTENGILQISYDKISTIAHLR